MTQATYDFSDYPDASYVMITDEAKGIQFNTVDDWNLALVGVSIGDPQVRKYEVTVPGRDGTLDLSNALGGVYYENRDIELRFACINYSTERFHVLASTIRNAIEGRVCHVTLSDDLAYYWRGRPQVDATWPGIEHSEIVITMSAEPHKYSIYGSYEAWKWSPFNFVTGVVTQEEDIVLTGGTALVPLPADPARGKVTLWLNTGNAKAKLSTQSMWKTLTAGENVFPEIRLQDKETSTLQLKGTGSVGVDYRIGSL